MSSVGNDDKLMRARLGASGLLLPLPRVRHSLSPRGTSGERESFVCDGGGIELRSARLAGSFVPRFPSPQHAQGVAASVFEGFDGGGNFQHAVTDGVQAVG